MCTAIMIKQKDGHPFVARNFDYDPKSQLKVTKVPRNYPFTFEISTKKHHVKYAMIGMTLRHEGTFVFVDGVNEVGLCCAILDLPTTAPWNESLDLNKTNLLPTDVSFYFLTQFATVTELRHHIDQLNIMAPPHHPFASTTKIHWMVCDQQGNSIVIEQTETGLQIYDNEIGVLTNSPTFDQHLMNLSLYLKKENELTTPIPGDYSSPSRFIRAALLKKYIQLEETPSATIHACFQILSSVAMLPGVLKRTQGENYETRYTACMSLNPPCYHYKLFNSFEFHSLHLTTEDLENDPIVINN